MPSNCLDENKRKFMGNAIGGCRCDKCCTLRKKHSEYMRSRRQANPDSTKGHYNPAKYAANPEKWQNYNLKTKYGITLDRYKEMLVTQNEVCAICLEPCSSGKSLSVDHNHKTKKVRGLLCADCNRAIGMLKDSPELLRTAATYIEENE